MAARTLLQQAVPTTFGLKAAGWLVSVLEARGRLAAVRDERLAAQLGGAAGTLAALGDEGPEVARLYAAELGLADPLLPWHTNRQRIAELGAALDGAARSRKITATSCSSRRRGGPSRRGGGRKADDAAEAVRSLDFAVRAWRTRTQESAREPLGTSAVWLACQWERSPARSRSPEEQRPLRRTPSRPSK
jgi:hypothetical protein